MKDTYKGMTGGLFDGRPLEVTRDPSRDIKAQQIAASLDLIHRGTPLEEDVWKGVYAKCGKEGEPTGEWKRKVMEQVSLLAATNPDPMRDMEITSKYAGSTWVKSLTSLAHRLME